MAPQHTVAEAAAPFQAWLLPAELEDLLDYLDTAFATHPVVRTLATRAAKELVPPAVPALRREGLRWCKWDKGSVLLSRLPRATALVRKVAAREDPWRANPPPCKSPA